MKRVAMGALAVLLTAGTASFAGQSAAQTAQGRSRNTATGAVSAIDGIPDGMDFVTVLSSRVPGVTAFRRPDGRIQIRVRGAVGASVEDTTYLSPLVIIDGMPVHDDPGGRNITHTLDALQPWEVDRIEVLRDIASTSVYGTRGARGVILIYLKRH